MVTIDTYNTYGQNPMYFTKRVTKLLEERRCTFIKDISGMGEMESTNYKTGLQCILASMKIFIIVHLSFYFLVQGWNCFVIGNSNMPRTLYS